MSTLNTRHVREDSETKPNLGLHHEPTRLGLRQVEFVEACNYAPECAVLAEELGAADHQEEILMIRDGYPDIGQHDVLSERSRGTPD